MAEGPAHLTPERLRALGAALHEITASMKVAGPGQRRRWFQGPAYTDLFVDFEDDQLVRWELTFASQWLAVERTATSTGRTNELELDPQKPASKLVTRDAERSEAVVAAARAVLAGLCDDELRDALLSLLPA